jgi:outer membrane protein
MRISSSLSLCAALLSATCAFAETKIMTLREALDLALQQNPDIMLARLDQQKARDQVTIARDLFHPKVFAGSGGAWTTGPPSSIDGSAPSIFETRTQMALFNQPQRFQVAAANESVRGAEIDLTRQQEEIAYQVARLYFDAEQAARSVQAAQSEIANLSRVADQEKVRVDEGRDNSIELKKAHVNVTGARRRADALAEDLAEAETSLAVVLGMKPDDRVRAAQQEHPALMVAVSEQESIDRALENSPELKRLESNMQAKELEIKGYKAERLPKVNLVAQYELLAKYSYQQYFANFQRNAAQLGASIEVPVLMGRSARAYVSQAEADIAKLRIQTDHTRARITADLRKGFLEVKRAESSRDYAREDLDVAREQVSVNLAQNDEGRLPLSAVEQARAAEQEKWLAYYEAQHAVDVARLNILRQTGTLLAAVK